MGVTANMGGGYGPVTNARPPAWGGGGIGNQMAPWSGGGQPSGGGFTSGLTPLGGGIGNQMAPWGGGQPAGGGIGNQMAPWGGGYGQLAGGGLSNGLSPGGGYGQHVGGGSANAPQPAGAGTAGGAGAGAGGVPAGIAGMSQLPPGLARLLAGAGGPSWLGGWQPNGGGFTSGLTQAQPAPQSDSQRIWQEMQGLRQQYRQQAPGDSRQQLWQQIQDLRNQFYQSRGRGLPDAGAVTNRLESAR